MDVDVNAFFRGARGEAASSGAAMPANLAHAAGLDQYLVDMLFADQAPRMEAAREEEARAKAERQRLASAVARLMATDDGKLLRGYLAANLAKRTFLVLQGLSNEQVVQLGAFKEGADALTRLIFELEKEGNGA